MRGSTAKIGKTRVAPNGYHYIKVEKGWRLRHHVEMEKHLGRPLQEDERVHFKSENKADFSADNLFIVVKRVGTAKKRLAVVEAKIEELLQEKAQLEREIASSRGD